MKKHVLYLVTWVIHGYAYETWPCSALPEHSMPCHEIHRMALDSTVQRTFKDSLSAAALYDEMVGKCKVYGPWRGITLSDSSYISEIHMQKAK